MLPEQDKFISLVTDAVAKKLGPTDMPAANKRIAEIEQLCFKASFTKPPTTSNPFATTPAALQEYQNLLLKIVRLIKGADNVFVNKLVHDAGFDLASII